MAEMSCTIGPILDGMDILMHRMFVCLRVWDLQPCEGSEIGLQFWYLLVTNQLYDEIKMGFDEIWLWLSKISFY